MVGFILRQTCKKQNQGSQDIIWIQNSNDPTRIKASRYLYGTFHLKIHMDIDLSLEWSGQKLVALCLPFSCL